MESQVKAQGTFNAQRFFEAVATIIANREKCQITVKRVKRIDSNIEQEKATA